MAPALNNTSDAALHPLQNALIVAADDVAAVADLLTLLRLAGVGMVQDRGAAIVRGAMIAHDHLEAVRAQIQWARSEIQRPDHTEGSDPEGTVP